MKNKWKGMILVKKGFCILITLLAALFVHVASADPIIPADEFPSFNSEWNINNRGHFFTDGEYFFVNGGDGRIYRLDDQLQLGQEVFDSNIRGVDAMLYREDEHMLYFTAERVGKNKESGLYRVKFMDGVVIGEVQRLVKGAVSNYAMDDQYICYSLDGYNGIYRIDHDGENRIKISRHEIQVKNPAIRMHIDDGILYYINIKDHCLWSVPLDVQDDEHASLFIERPMHYFLMVPYLRESADVAEKIVIYVEYQENTFKLDEAHLAVVDMKGERVRELDYLRDIQSR